MTRRRRAASMPLMAFKSWFYDAFLALGERRGMAARRAALLAQAEGRVLEIGAGTGLNLAHYPASVGALVLTEPDAAIAKRLHARAAASGLPVSVVEAGAQELPFPDASFDTVVSTMVLCTVPDADAAIDEIRRVLAPDGKLLFIEHVLADDPRLARWQHRLRAPWSCIGEGCQCNRETTRALAQRMRLGATETATWSGMPRVVHPLVIGEARRR
jgi:ubiquinone/menaquinone biosynthesis C-methylase UbiE